LQVTLFFLCRNPNLKKEFCNILLFWKWFSLTHKVNTSRIKFRIFGSDNSSEWLIWKFRICQCLDMTSGTRSLLNLPLQIRHSYGVFSQKTDHIQYLNIRLN
jgi:hypothetical protein